MHVEHVINTMSFKPYAPSPGGSRTSSTFIYDGYGWSCPYCTNTPYHLRAPGSFYSRGPPSTEFMEQHLSICAEAATASHQTWGQNRAIPPGYPSAYQPNQQPNLSQATTYLPSAATPVPPEPRWQVGSYTSNEHYQCPPPYGHPRYEYPNNAPLVASEGQSSAQYHALRVSESRHEATVQNDGYYQEAIALLSSYDQIPDNSIEAPLVLQEDKLLITDYFYYVNKQLKLCRFTEDDRKTRGGKRDTIAVGFAGLECRHCAEACLKRSSSSRKFFWSNVDRLANSFSEIPGHILKCRNCPKNIKEALAELKKNHAVQLARLPRGSQKDFLRKMWERLHNQNNQNQLEVRSFSPEGMNELLQHQLSSLSRR